MAQKADALVNTRTNELRKRWKVQRLALERTIIVLAIGVLLAIVLVAMLVIII